MTTKKRSKPKAVWVTFGNDDVYWTHWNKKQADTFVIAMHFSKHDIRGPVKYVREMKGRKA